LSCSITDRHKSSKQSRWEYFNPSVAYPNPCLICTIKTFQKHLAARKAPRARQPVHFTVGDVCSLQSKHTARTQTRRKCILILTRGEARENQSGLGLWLLSTAPKALPYQPRLHSVLHPQRGWCQKQHSPQCLARTQS